MAITVFTRNPEHLLKAIKVAIDRKDVPSWTYDSYGDFYHTPTQRSDRACFRAFLSDGMLAFGLIGHDRVDIQESKLIYGFYHGRFVGMLLAHFGDEFSVINAWT